MIQIETVKTERDYITFMGKEPNPTWKFVDRAGKTHWWKRNPDKEGWEEALLPTLMQREVIELGVCDCCGADTEHTHMQWFVPETGETVEPGYRDVLRHRPMRNWLEGTLTSTDKLECRDEYNFSDCEFKEALGYRLVGRFLITGLITGLCYDRTWTGVWTSTGKIEVKGV